jgi:hypothetical protein
MRVPFARSAQLIPLAASLFLLNACSNDHDPATDAPTKPVPVSTGNSQVDAARLAVAAAAGVEVDQVVVKEAGAVQWASAALGCPEPGMNYATVITPGVLIRLEVDGKTYRYHASPEGEPFPCPDDRAEPPAAGGMAIM